MYLSKRYTEFYNLMLQSDGNTKALKPVESRPAAEVPAGYSRPPIGPPQTQKLAPSLLYAGKPNDHLSALGVDD